MTTFTSTFTTTDGVQLQYDDTRSAGPAIILLHGWGQTRAMFDGQRNLQRTHRVITVDFRGHGRSGKPDHGYRISRFAADVRDLADHLALPQFDLLGWSMGASVIWSYIDLFGTDRIRSIIIVDQPAAVAAMPWMSEAEQNASGAILPIDGLLKLASDIRCDRDGTVTEAFVRGMFSGNPDPAVWSFVASEIRQTAKPHSATLLFDHGAQNWLDVLPRINRPSLVIGCDGSHVATESQRFLAEQIPGAQVHIFGDDIARSHFPFLENPAAFNEVVAEFLNRVQATQLVS